MDWDWNGIRHFTTLVEKQTLTAAAEHLGVQHSTVSRQIAQLENALGLCLLDRIGKRYLLTPEGERLYRHACEICKDMSMLQRTAREQAELRHSVVISAPPFVARLLLMPTLPISTANTTIYALLFKAMPHSPTCTVAKPTSPCASSAPPKTTLPCAASPISPTASTAMKAT